MFLQSTSGNRLELSIVEYQFPFKVKSGPNWLMVKGKVRTRTSRWQFVDPCLEDVDFPALASFLRDVAEQRPLPGAQESFCEPHLAFELLQYCPDGALLRLNLSQEARPHGFKHHTMALDFQVTSRHLWHSAAELDEEISAFGFLSTSMRTPAESARSDLT